MSGIGVGIRPSCRLPDNQARAPAISNSTAIDLVATQADERYLIGVERIDRGHRRLLAISGRLSASLLAGNRTAVATARDAVAELLEYAPVHFASEEALMRETGYPPLDEHRATHRRLLLRMRDLQIRAHFYDPYLPTELIRVIRIWLDEHILPSDGSFGAFMLARTP